LRVGCTGVLVLVGGKGALEEELELAEVDAKSGRLANEGRATVDDVTVRCAGDAAVSGGGRVETKGEGDKRA
jgi:hypothetical protein